MKLEWPGQKCQPGIIDDLTEDSPILDIIKVEGRQPQALERGRKAHVDIDGPGWTDDLTPAATNDAEASAKTRRRMA